MKHNFSDRYLQGLKKEEKDYFVREGHGFAIRVLPSGVKTFYYIFEFIPKKQKKISLGIYLSEEKAKNIPAEDRENYVTLKEARTEYERLKAIVLKGIDPTAPPVPEPEPEPAPEVYTVKHLLVEYIASCKLNKLAPKTLYDTERTITHDVIPVIGDRAVSSIRRPEAIKILEGVAARAPGQGRNVLKAARAMFAYALNLEKHEYNPFIGTGKVVPVIAPQERQRVLSEDEIKHVWSSLYNKKNGPGVPGTSGSRAALLLTLVTAQRPGEVCGTPKSEIDGDWWTINVKRIKTRRKNPYDQRVFLTPLAKWLLPEVDGEWYFPAPDEKTTRTESSAPILENSLSRPFSRVRRNKAGELTRPLYLGLPQWQPHDLRRTASTRLSKLGCPNNIIDAIINHVQPGSIGNYNMNEYDAEKEHWLTKWSEYLEQLVATS